MSKLKYYKLGAKASNFWDPSQPEEDNKKLTLGQVKPLHTTKSVSERIKSGGLVIAEEDDYNEYQKNLKALNIGASKSVVSKSVKDANKKTKEAVEAKENAEKSLKEAVEALDGLDIESKSKDEELAELRAKVEALENTDGSTEAKDNAEDVDASGAGEGNKEES